MTAPRISLAQQIEAVRFAASRQRSIASGATIRAARGRSVEEYDTVRLGAAARTLAWLASNEEAVRAFIAARREPTP
jgi:hypothetical protein